jgi:hypothetical protein
LIGFPVGDKQTAPKLSYSLRLSKVSQEQKIFPYFEENPVPVHLGFDHPPCDAFEVSLSREKFGFRTRCVSEEPVKTIVFPRLRFESRQKRNSKMRQPRFVAKSRFAEAKAPRRTL